MNKKIYALFILLLIWFGESMATMPPSISRSGRQGWAWGLGFGTEASYSSVTSLEVKTSTLVQWMGFDGALVLQVESKEVAGGSHGTLPIHLLWDFSTPIQRDLLKSYIRLGGGSVLIDEPTLFSDKSFFNFQFQLGMEWILFDGHNLGYGAFFTQAMLNTPAIRHPPLGSPGIYNGTSLLLGLRTYF